MVILSLAAWPIGAGLYGAPAINSTICLEAPVGSGSPILPRPGLYLCTSLRAWESSVHKTDSSEITLAGASISVHIHPPPQDVDLHDAA